jgi:uncharacterized protein HemX
MNGNDVDFSWLWSTLSAAGAGAIGWIFGGKRQAKLANKKSELENTAAAIAIWRETAERLADRCDKLETHATQLEQTLEEARKEIRALREELAAAKKA